MRQLNLDQLHTLKAIMSTGGFTAAARVLNLSQSAVSSQMRELEHRLGVPLLERVGKRARLTEAGRDLMDYAERLLATAGEAVEMVQKHRRDGFGRVHVGAGTAFVIYRLSPIIAELRAAYPSLDMRVSTATSDRLLGLVERGEMDMALINEPVIRPKLRTTPLAASKMVAIFPHASRRLPAVVEPADLLRWPLLLEPAGSAASARVREWFETSGPMPHSILELDSLEVIGRLVGAGLGASIVPEALAQDRERLRAFAYRQLRPEIVRPLMLIERADRMESPARALLRDTLVAAFGDTPDCPLTAPARPQAKTSGGRKRRSR